VRSGRRAEVELLPPGYSFAGIIVAALIALAVGAVIRLAIALARRRG
jgi:hypothetical protein